MKEVIQNAKTVQAAIEAGARELGVDVCRVTHVVLEEPKKGIRYRRRRRDRQGYL